MSDEKICLASGDGHVGPPTLVYKDYLEKWLHPQFDKYYASHIWRWSPQSKDSFFPAKKNAKFWDTEGFDPERGTPVAWDPTLRLKAMDQVGVATEILLPDDQNTNDPPFGSGLGNASVEGPEGSNPYPPELVRNGARAYNRWLAEFCAADPDRLRGITIVGTMDDVSWCVEEVRRAYDSGLRTGLMLALDYYLPPYHHPRYDILWETCQELNLTLVTHISRGHPHYLGEDPRVQMYMYNEGVWYAQRPIWTMIMGGVFEKFPKLRLVTTELGVGWVAPLLAGLDDQFDIWPGLQANRDIPGRVDFSLTPSEYWARQCFVTHSTAQRKHEFEGEAYDNVPNMVFGADIGHDEGWWPVFGFPNPPEGQPEIFELPPESVEDAFKSRWGGLSASKIVPYLQDNFFRAYANVDRAALQPVADRVGPSKADIGLI